MSHRKEAAKAEAELNALQQDQEGSIIEHLPTSQLHERRVERTKQFVESQLELNRYDGCDSEPKSERPRSTPRTTLDFDGCVSSVSVSLSTYVPDAPGQQTCCPTLVPSAPAQHDTLSTPFQFNPNAGAFCPTVPDQMCSELTKFIVKKDLILSRLTKFDDTPELFSVWKSTFHSVMSELGVTPLEEIDLLIKYLGSDSVTQAKRIRAANARDPSRGLQRIWERLEDCYALPEMVEASLKRKVSSFPRIANKDFSRLYELSDLASEIESLKEDPHYATLFAYYDSSSGVKPMVAKLPQNIQDKFKTNGQVR